MIFIPTFFQAYHTYPSLSYPSPRISMSALFHTPHHLFSHYISTPSPFNTSYPCSHITTFSLSMASPHTRFFLQVLTSIPIIAFFVPTRPSPVFGIISSLQAYKKIGFRNKNYVPVGVRGVFGGVVQNMHLHWKFHETVQVCCDNFPKEKIKEMALEEYEKVLEVMS